MTGRTPGRSHLREIGVVPRTLPYLRSLWRRRDFIWLVPLGHLQAQTHSTALGAAWHLLNPLLTAALYYLVFGVLFDGRGLVENYPAFLIVGIFTFLFMQRTIAAGAKSVTSNKLLVTQINFPRLALPTAAAVAETVSHGIALIPLFLILPAIGIFPTFGWFAALPVVALQAIFNLGAAMVVARLAFQFRDIDNLLPHLLRFWLYASGTFFTIDLVIRTVGEGNPLVTFFALNPAYIHMELMRAALLGHDSSTWMWVAATAWAVTALVGGFHFFRAREVEYGRG